MKKLYILVLLSFATLYVAGQSVSSYVIASAGESNEAGGINISWTLGEIAIETLEENGNTLILTQGFQQGYFEISFVGERLINNLMRTQKYNGKKISAYKVVKSAFEVIEKRTKSNPIQVLINAIEHAASKQETTRLRFGGISVPKAVDTAPHRRLDSAFSNIF